MWSGNFKTAIANLRSSKWRSLLTMMGVIIGITLVVTIVSLGEGLKQQIVGQANELGRNVLTVRSGKLVSRSGGQIKDINVLAFLNSSTLTAADIAALSQLPSITKVTPMDFLTSNVSSDSGELNDAFVIGTSSDLPDLLNQKLAYGDFFQSNIDPAKFAVIGSDVAHRLFGELNPTGHTISIANQNYTIRGVLAPSSSGLLSVGQTDFNSAVFIPFEQARTLGNGGTNILQILFKSKSNNLGLTVQQAHKALLASHQGNEDFSILKQEELLSVVNGLVNKFTGFISALAAISLLVGGIGIMDIMLASVSERTREIGIRKAVGATNRQILNQFLTEGLALTLVGGFIGVIFSLLVFGLLRLYTGLHPVITIPIMVLAVGVSVTIGVIFSIAPALKAARKDPINALRGD